MAFSCLHHTSTYFLSHTIIELNFIFKPSLRDRCYFNFADKEIETQWIIAFKITLLTGHRLAAQYQFCMTWTSAFFSLFHAWVFLTILLVTLEEVSVLSSPICIGNVYSLLIRIESFFLESSKALIYACLYVSCWLLPLSLFHLL